MTIFTFANHLMTFCVGAQLACGSLKITEFVAVGNDSQETALGNYPDWIEIFNDGAETVSLEGHFLTDDEAEPTKWTFPTGKSLGAGEFLIVFASGEDPPPSLGELHAGFKLSGAGEYLALLTPTQEILTEFALPYPEQLPGFSYGFSNDGAILGFFSDPTPGAANGALFNANRNETQFSTPRGTFSEPFQLTISNALPEATIRYTLDGSVPTLDHGEIASEAIEISRTSVVRAVALKEGFLPSEVVTHSYLFVADVATQDSDGTPPPGWPAGPVNGQLYDYGMDPEITSQYTNAELEEALSAIPSVMITVDQADFTDPVRGIHANAGNRGRGWERPAHLEILDHSSSETLGVGCGVRIRGGYSRTDLNAKHSLRLYFRAEYGPSTLKTSHFGSEGTDEFKKIDIRFPQSFSWVRGSRRRWSTYLHELVTRDLQREAGEPYTRSKYHHIYINGIYFGLGMTQERPEANFGATYLGGSAEDFDTLKSGARQNGYRLEASDGELNGDWRKLWDFARAQQAAPTSTRYLEMQGLGPDGVRDLSLPVLLDVDNLIHYVLILGFSGAYDNAVSIHFGGSNNWFSLRNRERDDRGFAHIMHDGENSFGAGGETWETYNDRLNITRWDSQRNSYANSNPLFLHMDLAESTPEYRQRFADLAHAALYQDGFLTRDRILSLIDGHAATIDRAIIAESARWGDFAKSPPANREDWLQAVADLRTLVVNREPIFLGQMREANLYPLHEAPELAPSGGHVAAGASVSVEAPEGEIYLTTDGSDPRGADGLPGAIAVLFASGDALTISEPVVIKTRSFLGGNWSALAAGYFSPLAPPVAGQLAISTLHAHPEKPSLAEKSAGFGDASDFEFLEIVNLSTSPVDLSRAQFIPLVVDDRIEGLRYTFPDMVILPAGERLVVVADLAAFSSRFPNVETGKIWGGFDGRLNNGGESLQLSGQAGEVLISMAYADEGDWPDFVAGESLRFTTLNSQANQSEGKNWTVFKASTTPASRRLSHFEGDPDADPDGNGVSALAEYFFGFPRDQSDGPMIAVELIELGEGPKLEIAFDRDPDALAILWELEISPNLDDWNLIEGEITVAREPLPGGLLRETITMPPPSTARKQFVRIKIARE